MIGTYRSDCCRGSASLTGILDVAKVGRAMHHYFFHFVSLLTDESNHDLYYIKNNWKLFSPILDPPYPSRRTHLSEPREMGGVEIHKKCELGDVSAKSSLLFSPRPAAYPRSYPYLISETLPSPMIPSFSFSVVPLPSRAICFDAAMSGPLTHRTG